MKTRLIAICLTAAFAVQANAIELQGADRNYGTLKGQFKAVHVISAESNGFDPSNGTAYLVALQYLTPKFQGFSGGVGFYMAGDLFGMTDFDIGPDERLARGLFVNNRGQDKGQIGEAYLQYQSEMFSAKLGRQMLDTPLTRNAYSTIPNFYGALMLDVKPMQGLTVRLGQITEMSLGARAATDFGLIGEGTPTAGSFLPPNTIRQAEFHPISVVTAGASAPDTDGITVVNVTYTGIENVTLSAWDYYVDEIANNVYLEGDLAIPVKSLGGKFKLSAQYLYQEDIGAGIAPTPALGGLDYNLIGIKAAFGTKKWSVYAAANFSDGDTFMLNTWGGDPAYTSSIFSRNAYREKVDAYKVGVSFKPMPGVNLMASYANYGQSDTISPQVPPPRLPVTDAEEWDLVAVYKPTKSWLLKTFYANRTSEYDGATPTADRTQSHWRVIAAYNF